MGTTRLGGWVNGIFLVDPKVPEGPSTIGFFGLAEEGPRRLHSVRGCLCTALPCSSRETCSTQL